MDYNKKGYKIALIALIFALIALSISGMPGTDGTNGTNAVLGTLTFSLHNISSDVTEYNSLKMDSVIVADVNKTQRTTIGIPNGVTLIQNWTSFPMNLTLIPAGAISMHIHALKVDGIAHDTKLQYDVGIVNSTGGNFISVGISDPQVPYLTTSEEEYDLEGVMLEKIINNTDRLALRLYTNQTGTGALPDVTIYMDDLTVSRLTIPAIPIDLTALINQVSANQVNIDTKINKSGDTMTGLLYLLGGFDSYYLDDSDATEIFQTPTYIGLYAINGGTNSVIISGSDTTFGNNISMSGYNITDCGNCAPVSDDNKVNKTGDTMTGLLNLTHGGSPLSFLTGINTAPSGSSGGAGLTWGADDGAPLATGNRLGFFVFQGSQDTAHTLGNPISIQAIANSTFTSINIESYLSFSLARKNQTSRTEMLRIEPTGNIRLFVDGKGITMDSPDGNSWCTTVSNAGVLTTISGACT